MKVLILTHGRSGGLSLSRWVGNELHLKLFHEPFINLKTDEFISQNLFTMN